MNGNSFAENSNFANLQTGDYNWTIKDSNECVFSNTFSIVEQPGNYNNNYYTTLIQML